jgi:hypothetical protein
MGMVGEGGFEPPTSCTQIWMAAVPLVSTGAGYCGYVSGAAAVLATNQAGATNFRPESHTDFEILHAGSRGELGYLVGVQHAQVRLLDQPDPVAMHLRITELYRREDDAWKLIHRHADPHAEPQPPPPLIRGLARNAAHRHPPRRLQRRPRRWWRLRRRWQ